MATEFTDSEKGFFARQALLPEGWRSNVRLVVNAGVIQKITVNTPKKDSDIELGSLVPGMPNLHSHAFQRGMAGLAEVRGPGNDSFWTWRQVMYRFLEKLTPDDLYAIACLAFIDMLESGFTRVGEFHYLHHAANGSHYADPAEMSQQIIRAAVDTGINLSLLPVFYAHSHFGGKPPEAGQRRFIHSPDDFATLYERLHTHIQHVPGAVLGVAPHSLRAVTKDELNALVALGSGPVHIHIAEQMKEVEGCLAWSGKPPVRWLLDNIDVNDRWCLVHATHMQSDEVSDLAATGAVAGLCPITEGNLGDGFFPFDEFLRAGGLYGIGSDSNVYIDVREELRLLEYGQRLRQQSRNVAARTENTGTGLSLWQQAVASGAKALGVKAGLSEGAPADMLALNTSTMATPLTTQAQLAEQLVFCRNNRIIDSVWVNGQQQVTDGVHPMRQRAEMEFTNTINRVLT